MGSENTGGESQKRSVKGSRIARSQTTSERTKKFNALLKRGKDRFERMDFRGAERCTSESLKLRRYPEAYFLRSLARQRLRNDEGSTKDMEKFALLSNRKVISLCMKASSLAMARGDIETGLKNFEYIIKRKCDAVTVGFIRRGKFLEQAHDCLGAIRQFTKAAEASPWSATPLMARGEAYMGLNDLEKARQDFSRAMEINECPQGYILRGICFFQLGNRQDALLDLTKALEIDPKSVDGLFCRAAVLNDMGKHGAALIDAEKARKISPNRIDFNVLKGVILLNMGRNEEVINAFAALPYWPGKPYLTAIALGRLKRFDEAIRCLGMAIAKDGNNHALYMQRYDMRLSVGDVEGAMEDHSRAMTLMENRQFKASLEYGLALMNKGLYEEALACASNAARMRPNNPDVYELRGSIHLAAGNNEDAIADFTKAIDINPNDAEYYSDRSTANLNSGNYAKALDDIEMALSILPKNLDLQYEKAQTLMAMERWEEAIACLSRVIRRDHDNDQLYYDRATCFSNQGRLREAIRDFKASLKLNPSNSGCCNDLGYRFQLLKDYDNALLYYKKAIDVAGVEKNAFIMSIANTNMALCMEEMGNNHGAMRHHNLAVEACPKRADSYYCRAELKKRMGDEEGARLDFDKSLDLRSAEELD